MKRLCLILGFLFFFCIPAQAKLSEGTFQVKGYSPGQDKAYQGTIQVIKSEETFTVIWKIGKNTYIGTAIEQGNSVAVMFMTPDKAWAGIALFIQEGNIWKGKWAPVGGKKLGREEWSPTSN